MLLTDAGIAAYAGEDLSTVDDAGLLADVVALHTRMQRLHAVWLTRLAEIDTRSAATEH